jgi:FkbM family methyltransferase
LQALLRPGNSFLDIGANIGYHSFFAAQFVGPSGSVFAFEPDLGLYSCLRRNLNQFAHATAFPHAVWDHDSQMIFERSSQPLESGWGTLVAVRDLGQGEHIQVQAVSIDSWAQQIHLNALRVIKVDAEGSEPAVIRGANETLRRLRPMLVIEMNDTLLRQGGGSADSLIDDLVALKYGIYRLSDRHLYKLDSMGPHSFAECICLPNELETGLLKTLRDQGYRS